MVGEKFRELIRAKSEKDDSRVILALDVTDEQTNAESTSGWAIDLVKETAGYLAAVKIGYPLVLTTGLGIVREVKEGCDLPVIADFKVADVPHTDQQIARRAYGAGADALIAHAFVGRDCLEAIVKVAEGDDRGVIVLPNMSHPGAEAFIKPVSESMAKLAVEVGATGIIGPATRPEEVAALRSWVGDELLILTPGVGAQGAQPGDAIKNGADFEIVGRAIYTADAPGDAAKTVRDRINERRGGS